MKTMDREWKKKIIYKNKSCNMKRREKLAYVNIDI
jgi:hypothetical protein